MVDYFKCTNCGCVAECEFKEWPVCHCKTDYSRDITDDFGSATEEEFNEWNNDDCQDPD